MKTLIILILFLNISNIIAQDSKILWTKSIGGNSNDEGSLIATDATGNVYLLGRFEGTSDFDPNPANVVQMTATDADGDIFIAKYTANGAFLWVKSFTIAGQIFGTNLKIDKEGNLIIVGNFRGTGNCDFDPSPTTTFNIASRSTSYPDSFIAKLTGDGNLVWAVSIPGNANSPHFSIDFDIDSASNILITGTYLGSFDFDFRLFNSFVMYAGTEESIFVAKYGPDLNLIYAKTINKSGMVAPLNILPNAKTTTIPDYAAAYHISVDKNGNAFIIGAFQGEINFPTNACPPCFRTLTTAGNPPFQTENRFIAKLDGAGSVLFAKNMDYFGYARDMKIDSNGNVFIFGYYFGDTNFNPPSAPYDGYYRTTRGNTDLFLLKFNNAGIYQWVNTFGTTNSTAHAIKLVIDENNYMYIFGEFNKQFDFTSSIPTANSLSTNEYTGTVYNLFLARLYENGIYVSAKNLWGFGGITPKDMTIDGLGNVYATGSYAGNAEMNFNSTPSFPLVASSALRDGFFMKLTDVNGTIKSGYWTDPTTWLLNRIPYNRETIIINPTHEVDINSPINVRKIKNMGTINLEPNGNITLNN